MDLISFTDGLQTTTSSFLRKDSQLELAVNVHCDNVGSVTKRLGYTEQGTATSSSAIRGLHSYADIAGGTTRLFRAFYSSIEWYSGSVWNAIGGTYSVATANVEMRVFLDQLFIFGANSSAQYITPINIDGTTFSNSTNLTGAPRGRFVETFLDQLYVADVEVSGVRYGSRFYRSSIPNSGGTDITWPTTNYENILTNNGETITGIHANNALNQLLIFKESSLHAWDTFRIKNIANIGTNAHRSIV